MKRKRSFCLWLVTMGASLIILLSSGYLNARAAGKVYTMKIQSSYPRGDVSMELLEDFAKSADRRSNGRLKIRVFADPELVSGEHLFEATKKGTVDMLHSIAVMWAGVLPVCEVEFGLPYAYNIPGNKNVEESAGLVRRLFFEHGFADLLREEYAKHGLFWLDMHAYGPIFMMSTKPMRTCEDLKGKKLRVEGSWTDYYNMLGARGTFIPAVDAYTALKLGTIDASQWDVSAVTGLKWHEVAPYRILGGLNDTTPGNILVNMKSWNALPKELKEALKGAALDYYHLLNKVYLKEMEKVAELVKQGKVIESRLDDACERKHAEAAKKIWDEVAARDAVAAEGIELIKTWRKTLK